jgi:signal peptidase
MKKIKGIINIILITVIFLFTVIFLLGISVTQSKGLVMPFGLVNISSGSMEPEIMAGDAALIKKIKISELEIGDIITFYHNGSIVTHKIIAISNATVTTKGIANENSLTETVYFNKIIGKYTNISFKNFYNFVGFVKSLWGFITFIMLPVFIMFILEVKDLINNISKRNISEKKNEI